jgi:hypothetical protein
MDAAALSDAAPGFDASRAGEIRATIDAPPPSLVLEGNDPFHQTARAALPAGAILYHGQIASGAASLGPADESKTPVRDRVTLHIPYDPEYCRIPNEAELTSFGDGDVPLTFKDPKRNLEPVIGLAWLDDDRLAVLTSEYVFALSRGGHVNDDGDLLTLVPNPTSTSSMRLYHFALDPNPGASGRRHVVVVANGNIDSAVYDVAIDRSNRVTVTATATLANQTIRDTTVDATGRVLVGGVGGTVFAREAGAPSFARSADLNLAYFSDGIDRILATGDRDSPYFATTLSRGHLFDRATGQWLYDDNMSVAIGVVHAIRFNAIASGRTADGSLDLWAAGQAGVTWRRTGGGPWAATKLLVPPRARGCSGPDAGGALIAQYQDLAMSTGYLHIAIDGCDAVLQVRRSDLCMSVATWTGHEIQSGKTTFATVAVREGEVVAGGNVIVSAKW